MKRTIILRGRQFTVDEDESCIHQLFWDEVENGHWEPYTFDAVDKYLSAGGVLLDVGAWLGAVSLYAAAGGAQCHAIEPDPVAYEMFWRNVRANPEFKIVASTGAIADRAGTLRLGSVDGLGSSMTSVHSESGCFDVPCGTLSDFARNMQRVDMVKIDVEGAEAFVLADVAFFESFRPTVLITLHPHLEPCDLGPISKLYGPIEQVAPDTYILEGRSWTS